MSILSTKFCCSSSMFMGMCSKPSIQVSRHFEIFKCRLRSQILNKNLSELLDFPHHEGHPEGGQKRQVSPYARAESHLLNTNHRERCQLASRVTCEMRMRWWCSSRVWLFTLSQSRPLARTDGYSVPPGFRPPVAPFLFVIIAGEHPIRVDAADFC